jgi:hypothetical protein
VTTTTGGGGRGRGPVTRVASGARALAAGGALVTETVAVAGWPFGRRDAQHRATTCPGRAAAGWRGQDRSSTTPLTIRYTPRIPNAVIMISRWRCQTHSVVRRRKSWSSAGLRLACARAAIGMANQIALYRITCSIWFALLDVLFVIALSS